MSEETAGVGKQRKRSESKQTDWTSIALQTAAFAGSALLSGFCMAAGGHAYTSVAKPHSGSGSNDIGSNADGSVIGINRKHG